MKIHQIFKKISPVRLALAVVGFISFFLFWMVFIRTDSDRYLETEFRQNKDFGNQNEFSNKFPVKVTNISSENGSSILIDVSVLNLSDKPVIGMDLILTQSVDDMKKKGFKLPASVGQVKVIGEFLPGKTQHYRIKKQFNDIRDFAKDSLSACVSKQSCNFTVLYGKVYFSDGTNIFSDGQKIVKGFN